MAGSRQHAAAQRQRRDRRGPPTTPAVAPCATRRDTDGSISYLALSDARGGTTSATVSSAAVVLISNATTHDDTFWLPIQRQAGQRRRPAGRRPRLHVHERQGRQLRHRPITGTPTSTFGDWSKTTAVYNSVGYGVCTLTYDLAFDDNAVVYGTSDAEQRKARRVRDDLNKAVLGTAGQTGLPGQDYDALPAAIVAISRAGAAQIGSNKGGQGGRARSRTRRRWRPDPDPENPTPRRPRSPRRRRRSATRSTISSARVSGTSVRVSLQLPGAGAISVASSTKPKRGSTIKLSTKTVNAAKSGAQTITVSLSSKAKKALKKDKQLKIALKITFTPRAARPRRSRRP